MPKKPPPHKKTRDYPSAHPNRKKQFYLQAARAGHTNISQFVLQASLEAAQTVLLDQSEFRLPPEQWKAFCERLDAPAKVIPALRQLISEPEPVA